MILIDDTISKNPAYNLALEEALLRRENDHNSYLLIYINKPSVVIGRHQNIYEEVNLKYCYENSIAVLRRISGGGAVWHDTGNLNFSFINDYNPKLVNNYRPFLEPVISSLKELGIAAALNEHNDLLLVGKKICGTAQFTSKGRMLTHGTLLFKADLQGAEKALEAPLRSYLRSKSKKSRASPIVNIADYMKSQQKIHEFKENLIALLKKNADAKESGALSSEIIKAADILKEERYNQWVWNYGRSPESVFERRKQLTKGYITLRMRIAQGKFDNVILESDFIAKAAFRQIENLFQNQKYDILSVKEISRKIKKFGLAHIEWISLFSE